MIWSRRDVSNLSKLIYLWIQEMPERADASNGEMADVFGVTPVHISGCVRELADAGLIRLSGTKRNREMVVRGCMESTGLE